METFSARLTRVISKILAAKDENQNRKADDQFPFHKKVTSGNDDILL